MAHSLWQLSLSDFRDQVASKQPTPSCGAAAAVSASFGLALIQMAIRLGTHVERGEAQELLRQSEPLQRQLMSSADEDARAFGGFIEADSEEARQQAARDSIAVPLATAHACRSALRLAEHAKPLVKQSVRPDVVAGALMLHAAMDAVLLNVEVNLALIPDQAERDDLAASRDRLRTEANQIWLSLQRTEPA
ncbi:cyclodeaminase/cyclohydrolase family protein [Pseudomonas sp. Marseille-QA0892]